MCGGGGVQVLGVVAGFGDGVVVRARSGFLGRSSCRGEPDVRDRRGAGCEIRLGRDRREIWVCRDLGVVAEIGVWPHLLVIWGIDATVGLGSVRLLRTLTGFWTLPGFWQVGGFGIVRHAEFRAGFGGKGEAGVSRWKRGIERGAIFLPGPR